jgi:hypothetical protein
MTTTARIDSDIKSLRNYFQKLFELLREAIEEDKKAPMVVVEALHKNSERRDGQSSIVNRQSTKT